MSDWKRRGVLSGICAAAVAPSALLWAQGASASSTAFDALFACQAQSPTAPGAHGDAVILVSEDNKWGLHRVMYKSAPRKPVVGTLVDGQSVLGSGEATLAILLVPSTDPATGHVATAFQSVRITCPLVGDHRNPFAEAMIVSLKFGDFLGSAQVSALRHLDLDDDVIIGGENYFNGIAVDFAAPGVGPQHILAEGRILSPEESQALTKAAVTQSSASVEVKYPNGTTIYSLDFTLDAPAARTAMMQSALTSATQLMQDVRKNCIAKQNSESAWMLD